MLIGFATTKGLIMLKTIVTAAILVTAAAPAFAASTESFTRDGETYVYTKIARNDRVVLEGRNVTTGGTFQLVVAGSHVSGVSNGLPVSFAVPAPDAPLAQVAAR